MLPKIFCKSKSQILMTMLMPILFVRVHALRLNLEMPDARQSRSTKMAVGNFDKELRVWSSMDPALLTQEFLLSRIMTPQAPCYLADYAFTGNEASKYNWGCGHQIPAITTGEQVSALPNNSVIHVQTNALRQFKNKMLPHAQKRLILVVGMWQVSHSQKKRDFTNVEVLNEILDNQWVIHVFMQNPEISPHTDYTALPYGVHFEGLEVFASTLIRTTQAKRMQLYVSPISIDKHRLWRPHWWPGTENKLDFPSYLEHVADAQFTTSPGGDRLDTYRHWEIIAFNGTPVTNLPPSLYEQLFCDDMVYVHSQSDLDSLFNFLQNKSTTELDALKHGKPNRDILLVSYWKQLLADAAQKQKGTRLSKARTCQSHTLNSDLEGWTGHREAQLKHVTQKVNGQFSTKFICDASKVFASFQVAMDCMTSESMVINDAREDYPMRHHRDLSDDS